MFIQTQEADEGVFGEIYEKYSLYFQFYGFDECKLIQICNVGQSFNMDERPEAFEEAAEAARRFCTES